MNIQDAPHGINVVIETTEQCLYIGRFDSTNGFTALLHDCDVHAVTEAEDAEGYIRNTAKYGVAVNHKDIQVDCAAIERVRLLGDIPKPD
jgi:hypothetical protein